MLQRLQKLMSARGVASRRTCEQMIAQGRVSVNGVVATVGQSVDDETDVVCLDGEPISDAKEHIYIMLNKPRGYVTTMSDELGRKTVAELVAGCGGRVYPVGRLDYNSEGLLIMTNDGALTNRLTHPSYEKNKTYHVWVEGEVEGAVHKLSEPMTIDGYKIKPAEVELLSTAGDRAKLSVTIHEGRNRQIRKMCQKCGLRVTRLMRVEEDGLRLGSLKTGAWRRLTQQEIDSLIGT
ncbi:MAG: rRNA pseudouridine synthase [Oscillospiraceae bacterium]|nr:rRNA pseudouridine synthase [Oscillospiraceae bacterium]